MPRYSRKHFLQSAAALTGSLLASRLPGLATERQPVLSGHLWVYASRFPPDWDCTPILQEAFRELRRAGLQGVELMEAVLRHDDAVPRLKELAERYALPVTGTSYYGDMWDKTQRQRILEDAEMVIERLGQLKSTHMGLTVGDAGRKKTADELDAQAEVLIKIMEIGARHRVVPNLHNHTFELADNLYDLKGTMERVPDLKLGPDMNWLVRGGIDPIRFIHEYGQKMVYLHLRDQDDRGKWTAAVGDGVTDFPGIAGALKAVGFAGDAAIELAFDEPPAIPVEACWRQSRDYVKRVFNW